MKKCGGFIEEVSDFFNFKRMTRIQLGRGKCTPEKPPPKNLKEAGNSRKKIL